MWYQFKTSAWEVGPKTKGLSCIKTWAHQFLLSTVLVKWLKAILECWVVVWLINTNLTALQAITALCSQFILCLHISLRHVKWFRCYQKQIEQFTISWCKWHQISVSKLNEYGIRKSHLQFLISEMKTASPRIPSPFDTAGIFRRFPFSPRPLMWNCTAVGQLLTLDWSGVEDGKLYVLY